MNIRYIDLIHSYRTFTDTALASREVEDVLRSPWKTGPASGMQQKIFPAKLDKAVGSASSSQLIDGQGSFVITAYDLRGAFVARWLHEKTRTIMKHKTTSTLATAWHERSQLHPLFDPQAKCSRSSTTTKTKTDQQATAEDEAAYHKTTSTMMSVPVKLVPKVQALIAKQSG